MKRIMAVYDVDPFYADRFAEFANQKEKTPFTAVPFTSLARLRTFAEQQPVELLLVGDDVNVGELEGIRIGQIIRLSDTGMQEEDGTPSVYKYQASDNVLREVMACYQVKAEPAAFTVVGTKSAVIGVYSPVGRCGKTSFCLTLGQVMARESKVLLLSLEEFSAYSRMMGSEYGGSLSDLLYYFRQGEYSRLRLGSVLYSWNGLDYVPPVTYAEDLKEVTGEEIAQLVSRIAQEGTYDTIILDLGHFGKGVEALLEVCGVIYTPVKEDSISVAKLEEWQAYLAASGRSHLWERVQKLKLPKMRSVAAAEHHLEQMLWGEMGDFVREIVSGRQKGWR